jgi:hypothetical protein
MLNQRGAFTRSRQHPSFSVKVALIALLSLCLFAAGYTFTVLVV